MAIHVGRDNFHYLLPDIMRSVSSAAFISVDFEFLGSPSTSGKDSRSLFDTPHEQYVKICSVVKRFPPCQLGLACFYDFETGIGTGSRYSVDVYCITLFKRSCKSDFSVSPATIRFLVQHGFNFNKFVTDGVTYSNRSELAKLEDKISKDVYDLEVFENGLGERVRSLKMRILCEMVDESEIFPDHCTKNASSRRHSVVIHLFREENEGYEFDECLWDRPLNSLEETLVVFALSQEFPDFEFHVNEKRTLLYVGRRPVMYYVTNEEKLIRRQESLKNLLQEIAGISSVFSRIFERKPPLVAHNCFLDLMYIYNCFHAELPVTYAEWKKEVHALLPIIVDTKILAGALKDLHATDSNNKRQPSPVILPIRTSLVINGEDESVSLWKRQQSYHNASFDALVTGDVFIKLAHLFVFTKCSHILDKSLPLHKLFFAVRTEVANKVPFPLTNVDCCKLVIRTARMLLVLVQALSKFITVDIYCGCPQTLFNQT
ncbi:CAF1 family ribonuclease [Dictyocaulus viviparus]|uniref:CAF1 family ribonuclease n=1 Tax=Dictyocaulus viviparus TaxID=29172 RepID=A0A0D8XZD8_DICVI|nr:CAF1 family ribonuclease [Dictyocaulus viviparus]